MAVESRNIIWVYDVDMKTFQAAVAEQLVDFEVVIWVPIYGDVASNTGSSVGRDQFHKPDLGLEGEQSSNRTVACSP